MNTWATDAGQLEHAQLAASDFDNTIAYTMERASSGIGVNEAYDASIEALFGTPSLIAYREAGGLQNRYPVEIVQQLAPDASPEELNRLTDKLTALRLDILLGQINRNWPRLSDGFLAAWEQLGRTAERDGQLSTAIISAGHAPFIHKTLAVWGARQPDILVADEDIRQADSPIPVGQRVKPAPFPMSLALGRWVTLRGVERTDAAIGQAARQTVYIGDSAEKDGGLAAQYDIPFVLISPETAPEAWQRYIALLGLGATATKSESRAA